MNPAERRIRQVKRANEMAVLIIALVSAVLLAYLAFGFGLTVVEWFEQLPWLLT